MLHYYDDVVLPCEFIMKFEENDDYITVYFADGHVQYYACNEDYKNWILERQEAQLVKILNVYNSKKLDRQQGKIYLKNIALLLGITIPQLLLFISEKSLITIAPLLVTVSGGNLAIPIVLNHQVKKKVSVIDELREELEKYAYWLEHKRELTYAYNMNNIDNCSIEQLEKALNQEQISDSQEELGHQKTIGTIPQP